MITQIINIFGLTGYKFLNLCSIIGAYFINFLYVIKICLTRPFYYENFYKEFVNLIFYSLPVVGLTALFSGAVLALQSYTGFSRFAPADSSVATIVVLSITRELGPVLTGLMLSGRVGSSIAAELATMRVTEQIDALYTLSCNPIKYLVAPRVFVLSIGLPMLVIVADIIGVFGGYLVSVYKLGFNEALYIQNTFKFLYAFDVYSGLIKAFAFGFIISSVGCYFGYNSNKGASGVGFATTMSVVASSVLILCSNYLITELMFKR
jgi:phospholipid/cholesterol/gamma-HCH transport system permease protein